MPNESSEPRSANNFLSSLPDGKWATTLPTIQTVQKVQTVPPDPDPAMEEHDNKTTETLATSIGNTGANKAPNIGATAPVNKDPANKETHIRETPAPKDSSKPQKHSDDSNADIKAKDFKVENKSSDSISVKDSPLASIFKDQMKKIDNDNLTEKLNLQRRLN